MVGVRFSCFRQNQLETVSFPDGLAFIQDHVKAIVVKQGVGSSMSATYHIPKHPNYSMETTDMWIVDNC